MRIKLIINYELPVDVSLDGVQSFQHPKHTIVCVAAHFLLKEVAKLINLADASCQIVQLDA